MTADEFEAGYAARSGLTVGQLHACGRYARPCHCGEPGCQGWAMGHQWEDAIVEAEIRALRGGGRDGPATRSNLAGEGGSPAASQASKAPGPQQR